MPSSPPLLLFSPAFLESLCVTLHHNLHLHHFSVPGSGNDFTPVIELGRPKSLIKKPIEIHDLTPSQINNSNYYNNNNHNGIDSSLGSCTSETPRGGEFIIPSQTKKLSEDDFDGWGYKEDSCCNEFGLVEPSYNSLRLSIRFRQSGSPYTNQLLQKLLRSVIFHPISRQKSFNQRQQQQQSNTSSTCPPKGIDGRVPTIRGNEPTSTRYHTSTLSESFLLSSSPELYIYKKPPEFPCQSSISSSSSAMTSTPMGTYMIRRSTTLNYRGRLEAFHVSLLITHRTMLRASSQEVIGNIVKFLLGINRSVQCLLSSSGNKMVNQIILNNNINCVKSSSQHYSSSCNTTNNSPTKSCNDIYDFTRGLTYLKLAALKYITSVVDIHLNSKTATRRSSKTSGKKKSGSSSGCTLERSDSLSVGNSSTNSATSKRPKVAL